MFSPIERMIAFRYLRSKRREGFISIIAAFSLIGIALGVATLIIVMAVMNGFRHEITEKILGFNGHVYVSSYVRNLANYEHFSDNIKAIDGVEEAIPVIDGQVMVTSKFSNVGALVKGISQDDLQKKPLLANNMTLTEPGAFSKPGGVVLGVHLAGKLGVSLHDKITLISPESSTTAFGTMPRLKSYEVVGFFDTGMYEYDGNMILMRLESAQLFFKYPNAVSSIEVTTQNPDFASHIAEDIFNAFNGMYQVQDWQQQNASLFNALKVERTVMFLILTLIVFIAAFNIISSLIMLVNDKSKDIAILRTMGASKIMITKIFFLCGASVGTAGTVFGFVLGLSFSLNIERIRQGVEVLFGTKLFDPVVYFLSELPADVQTSDVVWSVSMGLFFSFVATIYPALKASRQDPAEALRYE